MAASSSHKSTNTSSSRLERHARLQALAVILGVIALVGLLVMLGVHVSAMAAYRRSFDRSMSVDRRAASAVYAARLEPWKPQYALRAKVMTGWSHGALLLSQGADLPAMIELGAAYKLDVGDPELLATFKKAQAQLTLNSNFKAHIQHAHEGPGGTLRPQDLLR
jgi:hypothetical protein